MRVPFLCGCGRRKLCCSHRPVSLTAGGSARRHSPTEFNPGRRAAKIRPAAASFQDIKLDRNAKLPGPGEYIGPDGGMRATHTNP